MGGSCDEGRGLGMLLGLVSDLNEGCANVCSN